MLETMSGASPMRQRVRDARRWASTTPGRLRVLSLEIAVVSTALVAIGAGTLLTAMVTVNGIRQHTVPAIMSMQHVHAWLADADQLRLLLREVFTSAGGTHDNWDEYDRVMADERRTAVLITPERLYTSRR